MYFVDQPVLAIFTINYVTLFSLILEWSNWPRKDWNEQMQIIINEIALMFTVYHLLLLTEFVASVEVRMILVGNSALFLITSNVIIFLGFYLGP